MHQPSQQQVELIEQDLIFEREIILTAFDVLLLLKRKLYLA